MSGISIICYLGKNLFREEFTDDQISNQCKLCHLATQFAFNATVAIWWPNLLLMHVASPDDQILNQCKWYHLVAQFATDASGASWWPNFNNFSDWNQLEIIFAERLLKIRTQYPESVEPLAMFSFSCDGSVVLHKWTFFFTTFIGTFIWRQLADGLIGVTKVTWQCSNITHECNGSSVHRPWKKWARFLGPPKSLSTWLNRLMVSTTCASTN